MIKTLYSGLAALLLLSPIAATAHAYDAGDLHIGHPWIRTPPGAAPTAAGYLMIVNHGRAADQLLSASSPAAGTVEAHSMSMAGGVMRMRLLPGGFAIAPGGALNLTPSGDHLMLVGVKHPLKAGEHVPVTLHFAHAGAVKVDFIVQDDAPSPGGAMAGMDMK